MIVIVTDGHYRMAVSLIRDMVDAQRKVVVCESSEFPEPVGFCCKGVVRTAVLPANAYIDALSELCSSIKNLKTY